MVKWAKIQTITIELVSNQTGTNKTQDVTIEDQVCVQTAWYILINVFIAEKYPRCVQN